MSAADRPSARYKWNGAKQTHPTIDTYHQTNGQGLAPGTTVDHETMDNALRHIDRIVGAWREAGYDVLTVGIGITVAWDNDGLLRGATVFRDRTTHHPATGEAVAHVAQHASPPRAMAVLRDATRREGAPR